MAQRTILGWLPLAGMAVGAGLMVGRAVSAPAGNVAAPVAASLPVQTLNVKGHVVKAQIGKASDAAGQKVTSSLVNAIAKTIHGTSVPLKLKVVPGARAGQGYFNEIFLSARPGKVKKLPVSELSVYARNVHVDVPYLSSDDKVRTLASTTTLRAVITEKDLTELLAKGRSTGSMGLSVKYLPGCRFRVAGNWNWSWFSGPIVAVGKLRMASNNTIDVDVQTLKLNGAEVPAFLKTKFADKLNPVLDYNDVPFQPHFKTLTVNGNKAIITA